MSSSTKSITLITDLVNQYSDSISNLLTSTEIDKIQERKIKDVLPMIENSKIIGVIVCNNDKDVYLVFTNEGLKTFKIAFKFICMFQ